MNLPFRFRDCLSRTFERKKTLIVFAALFAVGMILGLIFVTTPAIYDYHITICDRFVNRVCFSDRNVFEIFLERTLGHAVLLLVIALSGIHPVGCVFPPVVLLYRAYTFGGSLYIFFSVYRLSGALIVVGLYLPVHLLIDAVLCFAGSLSYARCRRFCFSRQDWLLLFADFLVFFCFVLAIGLAEMLLLLALFHPLGNIF